MNKRTLSIEHETDTAHRLVCHKGKCKNLHGHRYRFIINVDVEGSIEDGDKFLDFYDFKQLVKNALDSRYDHKTILKDCKENKKLVEALKETDNEYLLFDKDPTVEHMIMDVVAFLNLQSHKLRSVTIYETPTNYCTWTRGG